MRLSQSPIQGWLRGGRRGEGAVNDDRLARRNRLDSGRLAPGCGLLGIFA